MKDQKNHGNGRRRAGFIAFLALAALTTGLTLFGKQPAQPEAHGPVGSAKVSPVVAQHVVLAEGRLDAPAPAVTVPPAPDPMHSEALESEPEQPLGRVEEQEQTPIWKAEETCAIARVVSDRVTRLEKEIAELERTGDGKGAASRRVLRTRLEQQLSHDGRRSQRVFGGNDRR